MDIPNDLVVRLMGEFNYPEKGAQLIAQKLAHCQPQVQVAFNHWWASGEFPTLLVEGYTVSILQQKHGMNPIAALLTLDWLLRDPQAALASLQRGHDKITVSDS